MSVEKNRQEGLRWLSTAKNDLEAAKVFLNTGRKFFNHGLNKKKKKKRL